MRVSFEVGLDADLCSGCGLCSENSPNMFTLDEAGASYVKKADGLLAESMEFVPVPTDLLPQVICAVEECPGEIITIQLSE